METQFNVRIKSPNGFFVVARSRVLLIQRNITPQKTKQPLNESRSKPRDGVAVYKNVTAF